jgi:hypothetical protein
VACLARDGDAVWGEEKRPLDLTVVNVFETALSSVEERAADFRFSDSWGDLVGKLRTCSRKGAE